MRQVLLVLVLMLVLVIVFVPIFKQIEHEHEHEHDAQYLQSTPMPASFLAMAELPKTYDPNSVEPKWYARWEEAGYFRADAHSPKPPYSIVIPPPNITGILTLGHVLNNTIQDILARRARMQGFVVFDFVLAQCVIKVGVDHGARLKGLPSAATVFIFWIVNLPSSKPAGGPLRWRVFGCGCLNQTRS